MHLKITAPDNVLFDGSVTKVTIPTEAWEITVLPNHQPLATVTKEWLMIISVADDAVIADEYVVQEWKIYIAVTKWMAFIDGEQVIVSTSAAISSPSESTEVLQAMKADMEAELDKIKADGNKEELESALMNLEKVTADLRLSKLKNVHQ